MRLWCTCSLCGFDSVPISFRHQPVSFCKTAFSHFQSFEHGILTFLHNHLHHNSQLLLQVYMYFFMLNNPSESLYFHSSNIFTVQTTHQKDPIPCCPLALDILPYFHRLEIHKNSLVIIVSCYLISEWPMKPSEEQWLARRCHMMTQSFSEF